MIASGMLIPITSSFINFDRLYDETFFGTDINMLPFY
jgi:hypothetical protein